MVVGEGADGDFESTIAALSSRLSARRQLDVVPVTRGAPASLAVHCLESKTGQVLDHLVQAGFDAVGQTQSSRRVHRFQLLDRQRLAAGVGRPLRATSLAAIDRVL